MDQRNDQEPYDAEDALDDFYEQLADVTPFDSHAMVAAWGAIDPSERTAAWQLVREETTAADRDDLLDEARESVLRWSRESGFAMEGSPYSLTHGDDLNRAEARTAALRPVLDAAAAVIVRDRLPAEVFDVLYAPWAAAAEAEPVDDETVDGEEEGGAEDDAEYDPEDDPEDDDVDRVEPGEDDDAEEPGDRDQRPGGEDGGRD